MLDYVYGETTLLHTVSSMVDISWIYGAISQTLAEFRLFLYLSKLIFQLRKPIFLHFAALDKANYCDVKKHFGQYKWKRNERTSKQH